MNAYRVDDREIERHLHSLFEQAPIGIAFLDSGFRFTNANPVFATQLGAPSASDLLGTRLPADYPDLVFHPRLVPALRDQRRVDCEITGRTPWGRSAELRVVAAPIERDGVGAYFLIARDASERRRLEEELRRSAARNEAILEATVDGIATIDAAGALTSVNSALEAMFGYSREELLGRNVRILMPEPYRSEHDRYLERFLESGVPRIIGIGREVEGQRKDGTVFPLRLSVGEVRVNGQRLFVGILGDLSARVEAEREASRLGVILEDSLNEIYVFDDESLRFRTVNSGARANLGYSIDELRALTPIELNPEFGEARFRSMLAPLQAGTVAKLDFKTTHRRKDGTEYRVEAHLQHRSASAEFVAIVLDITEREDLERQLVQAQRLEAVGQLAGGIAHDFNNLLASIQGSSELLETRLDPGDRSMRAVQRIRQAASRGAALTRHLLAFSRRQTRQPEAIDLDEVVRAIAELTARLLPDNVELVLDLEEDLPGVYADPTQIDQIVMNLMVNAGDAMPEGGRLEVSTRRDAIDAGRAESLEVAPGESVVLAVADTGVGIASDLQARIFEPFFTTKEVGKGTGLGLSTVYGIAKQCGWGIEVASEVDVGTRFEIWIPPLTESETVQIPESA